MNLQDKEVYDNRWSRSSGTPDEDILSLNNPGTQLSFFYYHYNKFISSQINNLLSHPKGKRLLELGCGRGTTSIFQAITNGLIVVPTDYSEHAVSIANRNMKRYNIPGSAKQADIFNLPFKSEDFDIVVSLGVMEHIENLKEAYMEMHKVLRTGGVMISMNVPEKPGNVQRLVKPLNRALASIKVFFSFKDTKPWLDSNSRSKTADVYRSEMTSEMFAEMAREAGFKQVRVYDVNPFPTIDPLPKFCDWMVTRLYFSILTFRKYISGMSDPYISTEKNSRAHFIVGVK